MIHKWMSLWVNNMRVWHLWVSHHMGLSHKVLLRWSLPDLSAQALALDIELLDLGAPRVWLC